MALISLLSRLVNGVQRQVDLSTNTLVLGAMQLKGATSGTFTQNVPATVTTYSVVWPNAQAGGSGYVLANDGSGNLSWIPSTATDVLDGTFRIDNTSDPTKKIAFDASGIATATTRTITMPDSNVNLGLVATAIQRNGSVAFTANQPMGGFKLTGLGAGTTAGDSVRYEQAILASGVNPWTANQSLGGFKITSSADPSAAQDLATKNYVDLVAVGLSPKKAVRVATTVAGTLASSFENGDTIDGIVLATGDRLLIKDQASASENGIYIVAASGAPSRSSDFDSLSPIDEINGAWVAVQLGTANAGRVFVQYGLVSTFPGDAINFEFYNPIASLIGGDMITVTGSTISVDLFPSGGLESSNGTATGQLRIKSDTVTANTLAITLTANGAGTKYDPNSFTEVSEALALAAGVAGAALTLTSGVLDVAVDAVSIEVSSDALRIKTTAYDQATITGGSGSAAAVAYAPNLKEVLVAGEAFAATTLFAVRFAKAADAGFVAGRVYKADNDATSVDNFWAIGLVYPAGSVSAGGNLLVHKHGLINVPAHGFTVGQPLWLSASGAVTATAPSASNICAMKLGMVRDANNIEVQIGYPHVA